MKNFRMRAIRLLPSLFLTWSKATWCARRGKEMRSRTVRQGSVGLLIITGVALFVGVAMWLSGLAFGKRSYTFTAVFSDVNRLSMGAPVFYRGVNIGKVTKIQPGANGIDVSVKISSSDTRIPDGVIIEANQTGLISETLLSIRPQPPTSLPSNGAATNPLSPECNSDLIICADERVSGEMGVSVVRLLRKSTRATELLSDPQFFNNLEELVQNASTASVQIAQASEQLQEEIEPLSETAKSLNNTAAQVSSAATQVGQLATNVDRLVNRNQGELDQTLNHLSATSEQLSELLASLEPTVEQVNSTLSAADTQQLVQNLETLTANAAQVSTDLRKISNTFSQPSNRLVLQQTLDSARVTFQNTQKITSELEELTGDPAFRSNLRELVEGLSDLVSSTQKLEEYVQARDSSSVSSLEVSPFPSPPENLAVSDYKHATLKASRWSK